MNIRGPICCRLSEETAAQLASIELESNRPPWSRDLFAQEFSQPFSRVYGARLGGHIVGFLVCHQVVDEAHIVNFAVRSEFRGRGVGGALISYLFEEFRREGIRQVTLEVRRSNQNAQNLYKRAGFEEVAVRHHYYSDDQEDAILMRAQAPFKE